MVAFKVPSVGTIKIRWLVGEDKSDTGVRMPYHHVFFDGTKFGTGQHRVKVYAIRADRGPTTLWGTVSEAMASVDTASRPSFDINPWVACAEIPVGIVEVTRERYHVTSDGCTSDRTKGTSRHKTIKIGRSYDESAMVAVMRHVTEWDGFKDAGTFDSIQPRDTTWRTVPVEGDPVRVPGAPGDGMGIPCIEHRITFVDGELIDWIPAMAREAIRGGIAWR